MSDDLPEYEGRYYQHLVETLLRPRRKGLAAARAAVDGLSELDAAAEALEARGLLPQGFLREDARELRSHGALFERFSSMPVPWTEAPEGTAEGLLALAADLEGVLTAEALALECVAALAPWGLAQRERGFVWIVGRPRRAQWFWEPMDRVHALEDAGQAALRGVDEWTTELIISGTWLLDAAGYGTPREEIEGQDGTVEALRFWAMPATQHAYFHEVWLAASREGHEVPTREGPCAIAELPSPYASLLALWELGYALDHITEDRVVLLAPRAEEPEALTEGAR